METRVYRRSRQRERMMDLLTQTNIHPTANWLYDNMKDDFPSLSLGTVYRNLGILEERGLIRRLTFGSTFDRFDARIKPHPHFVCRECGKVYDLHDLHIHDFIETAQGETHHALESVSIEFRGVCRNCIDKKK